MRLEAYTGNERRGRCHNHARLAGCQRVQRAGAGGCDAEVRRKTAIGVDFLRWERQHRVVNLVGRRAFKRAQKKPDVAHHLLDVAVGGNHQHHDLAG